MFIRLYTTVRYKQFTFRFLLNKDELRKRYNIKFSLVSRKRYRTPCTTKCNIFFRVGTFKLVNSKEQEECNVERAGKLYSFLLIRTQYPDVQHEDLLLRDPHTPFENFPADQVRRGT